MPVFTAVTYNLWGLNEPWRYTVERGITRGAAPGSRATALRVAGGLWPRRRGLIARTLAQARPEIVALQEARDDPTGGRSTAAQLADDLACFFAADHGLGLLSRGPIEAVRWLPLPDQGPETATAPVALHAVVTASGRPVNVIVCHLTPRSEAIQLATAASLLRHLMALADDMPTIVAGDFNAEPDSPTMRLLTAPPTPAAAYALRDAWAEANPDDPGPTMPSHAPTARIDYILVSGGLRVLSAARLGDQPDDDGYYPSDHLGVVATLRADAGADR